MDVCLAGMGADLDGVFEGSEAVFGEVDGVPAVCNGLRETLALRIYAFRSKRRCQNIDQSLGGSFLIFRPFSTKRCEAQMARQTRLMVGRLSGDSGA